MKARGEIRLRQAARSRSRPPNTRQSVRAKTDVSNTKAPRCGSRVEKSSQAPVTKSNVHSMSGLPCRAAMVKTKLNISNREARILHGLGTPKARSHNQTTQPKQKYATVETKKGAPKIPIRGTAARVNAT